MKLAVAIFGESSAVGVEKLLSFAVKSKHGKICKNVWPAEQTEVLRNQNLYSRLGYLLSEGKGTCNACNQSLYSHELVITDKSLDNGKRENPKLSKLMVYYMILALRSLAVTIAIYALGDKSQVKTEKPHKVAKLIRIWFLSISYSLESVLNRLKVNGGADWQGGNKSRKRKSSKGTYYPLALSLSEHIHQCSLLMRSEKLTTKHDLLVRMLCDLDDAYFKLYYYGNLTAPRNIRCKNKGSNIEKESCGVPEPQIYFKAITDIVHKYNKSHCFADKKVTQFVDGLEDVSARQRIHSFLTEAKNAMNTNGLLFVWSFYFKETVLIFDKSNVELDISVNSSEEGWTGQSLAPKCYQTLRSWRNNTRDWPARLFAYAVPTENAIDCILDYASKFDLLGAKRSGSRAVIEVGAGTGYWAWMLRKKQRSSQQFKGISILALDSSPTDKSSNEYHGCVPPFTAVDSGGTNSSILSSSERNILFLCYPPPDTSMALDCLKRFTGNCVVHVGEFQGTTGTRPFEIMLNKTYELIKTIQLPQFGNTANAMTIWKKRRSILSQSIGEDTEMVYHQFFRCDNPDCNRMLGGGPLRRCAYTRKICVCSEACALILEKEWKTELSIRMMRCVTKGCLYEARNSVSLKWPFKQAIVDKDKVIENKNKNSAQVEEESCNLKSSKTAESSYESVPDKEQEEQKFTNTSGTLALKSKSRKALETPKTTHRLHETTSAEPTGLGSKVADRPGKSSSNKDYEKIWNPYAESSVQVPNKELESPHTCKINTELEVFAEAERVNLAWKLRKLLKVSCRKLGVAAPILAFERWLIRGALEKDRRTLTLNRKLKPCNFDPLFPPFDWIDKGLIADLMRVSISEDKALLMCRDLNQKSLVGCEEIKKLFSSSKSKITIPRVVVRKHKYSIDVKLENSKKIYKIGIAHFEKLRELFHRNQKDNQNLFEFESALYILLARYQALSGHGFQAAVNEFSFKVLSKHLNVTFECFASPLNAHFGKFFSAFPRIDGFFGSAGSFFSVPPTADLEGSFEANPPFVSDVMTAMAERLHHWLRNAERRKKPLSFVVVIPGWVDEPSWKMLKNSTFLKATWLIAKADHGFCDGAQHQRQDRFRESPFDTGVFIVQSTEGGKRWPINESIEKEFREAMAEGFPTKAAQERRIREGRGMSDLDGAGGVYKGKKKRKKEDEGVEARRNMERKTKRKLKKRKKKRGKNREIIV